MRSKGLMGWDVFSLFISLKQRRTRHIQICEPHTIKVNNCILEDASRIGSRIGDFICILCADSTPTSITYANQFKIFNIFKITSVVMEFVIKFFKNS